MITENTVTSTTGMGGGLYMPEGTLNYEDPTISTNEATTGDGAYLAAGVWKNPLTEDAEILYYDDTEYSAV